MRKALQAAFEGEQIAFDWRGDPHWPHCLNDLKEVRTILEMRRESERVKLTGGANRLLCVGRI